MVRMLFVSYGNACRSVMAEAIARNKLKGLAEVSSAGVNPDGPGDPAMAIETLRTHFDIDVSGHIPRSIVTVDLSAIDCVVAMSSKIVKSLPSVSCKLLVWDIKDPWFDYPEGYLDCAKEIDREISVLAMGLKYMRI